MKRTKQTQTAQQAYDNNRMQVEGLLARIQHQLTIENAKQAADPKNYGFAGDLEEVASRLQDISNFLPVCMCKAKATCYICAADKAKGIR